MELSNRLFSMSKVKEPKRAANHYQIILSAHGKFVGGHRSCSKYIKEENLKYIYETITLINYGLLFSNNPEHKRNLGKSNSFIKELLDDIFGTSDELIDIRLDGFFYYDENLNKFKIEINSFSLSSFFDKYFLNQEENCKYLMRFFKYYDSFASADVANIWWESDAGQIYSFKHGHVFHDEERIKRLLDENPDLAL